MSISRDIKVFLHGPVFIIENERYIEVNGPILNSFQLNYYHAYYPSIFVQPAVASDLLVLYPPKLPSFSITGLSLHSNKLFNALDTLRH